MRKLSTRLALAMIAVGLLTLIIFSTLESLAFVREYRQLPTALRGSLGQSASRRELTFLEELPPRLRERYLESVEVYSSAIQNFQRSRRRTIFLSALIALALGIVLALLLSQRITRPLTAVSKAAGEMKQGKFSARVEQLALQNADEETLALSQSFNDMAETLEKNELERKTMIADIAHELRTPLAVMQARFAAMQDKVIPLNNAEIERVYKQTELLSRLITDLRTLSLAEAGRLSLQKRDIDVNELLQYVVSSFEASAKLKHIRLELSAPDAVTIHADTDRLTQVFSNLLGNALRYTPEDGRIKVGLESRAQKVSVYIHDSGPGLSTEALTKVFDRFYKGDERSGSGLGLAIVKTLVELHGGVVTARNHSEGGAVFEITLLLV